jgi:hypothetical protein
MAVTQDRRLTESTVQVTAVITLAEVNHVRHLSSREWFMLINLKEHEETKSFPHTMATSQFHIMQMHANLRPC